MWKKIFPVENRKSKLTIEFCELELVKVPNFILNWQFWLFGPDFPKKGNFGRKQKLASPLNCAYSNYTRYHLSAQTDNFDFFEPNLPQKGYFRSKMEKVKTTIEFCIFKLVQVPSFNSNWQFWFFWPNLPKKGCFWSKTKKWTSPLNSAYSNWPGYQISA